jgi:hypothetical protein
MRNIFKKPNNNQPKEKKRTFFSIERNIVIFKIVVGISIFVLAVIFTIIFPAYGDKIGATAGGILFI